jgi:hypothetical protein
MGRGRDKRRVVMDELSHLIAEKCRQRVIDLAFKQLHRHAGARIACPDIAV